MNFNIQGRNKNAPTIHHEVFMFISETTPKKAALTPQFLKILHLKWIIPTEWVQGVQLKNEEKKTKEEVKEEW